MYGAPVELPPPPPSARKMSSPSLEQYHVASRSPEQQRRQSMMATANQSFTLAPLQSFTSGGEGQAGRPPSSGHTAVGQDVSHLTSHEIASKVSESSRQDATTLDTYAQNREPDYRRNEPTTHRIRQFSPPAKLSVATSSMVQSSADNASSPAAIKHEPTLTPQDTASPIDQQRRNSDAQTLKALTSLKNEHGLRHSSPLRESSTPMPSTEMAAHSPSAANNKKRPAPAARTKKGTATSAKKAPPAKKRKVEPKRSTTPSSRTSKTPAVKAGSTKGTPANSSPAPSLQHSSTGDQGDEFEDEDDMDDGDDDGDGDVYCVCRRPDNGTFMIGCDGTCDDWFHGKCVGIAEADKNLIDKYICPNCKKSGQGSTLFKPVCRRQGCRQPARAPKNGKNASKYCSDECGVLYFREMAGRTRGREKHGSRSSHRRKNSFISDGSKPDVNDGLGARGGALAAGEIKALVDSSKNADDFKRLGDGVLSPPATPENSKPSALSGPEAQLLQEIRGKKEDARCKHQLLKDRIKFVTLAKQAASRIATEKELKPKEMCGYDERLAWSEEQFANWRDSTTGRQAFELETLQTEKSSPSQEDEDDLDAATHSFVCMRKKCARHHDWAKLAVDDIRFEMSENSESMRALDKEEKELRERVAMRGRHGNGDAEGKVEVHGLGITDGGIQDAAAQSVVEPAATDAMQVDAMQVDEPDLTDGPMEEPTAV